MEMDQSRRHFLSAAGAAEIAGVSGLSAPVSAQEGRLETTTVRIAKISGICIAPQYAADDLLRAEGFTDIRYIATDAGVLGALSVARGEVDSTANYASALIIPIGAGEPIAILAGEHTGCFELFAHEDIRTILDLHGKTVGVQGIGSSEHIYLSLLAAQVGLDPVRDIHWVTSASPRPMDLFVDRKIDAFLCFPPDPQELRARKIGHAIVTSSIERPWSQYFCCMLAAHRDYARRYPVATKRVLRAIVKAADLCVTQPQKVAQRIVDRGFAVRYDYALQSLNEIPYTRWREYDPEDTIRFYSLRLRETGMIKSNLAFHQ